MPARELRKIEISSEHPFPERGVSVVGILAVRAFVRCSVLAVEGEDTFDRRILASNLQTALEGSPPRGVARLVSRCPASFAVETLAATHVLDAH